MSVQSICSKKLITVDIKASLQESCYLMYINDIRFLPVTKDNETIGIITDHDIVIYGLAQRKYKIKDIMRQQIIRIGIDDNVDCALKLFKKYKVKHLLVTDKGKDIAILSLSDIIRAYDIKLNKQICDTIKDIVTNSNNDINPSVDAFEL